ncbi:MAG: hypothetical protein HS111_37785 [Kofleriaceae bacterium]|nr:hypothetical protein [Kofleriaceae bacterium]MCL4223867.1 hypothetical protein [Myxococcales bacterium]
MVRFLPLALAVAALLGARGLGAHANATRATWPTTADLPYAPAPAAAPYVTLGYREAAADLLWIRAIGYVGGDDDRASGSLALVRGIAALDPRFERVYAFGAIAVTAVGAGATRADMLGILDVLARGMAEFPDNCKIPLHAGQIYTIDLDTEDPAEKERWQLEGARLLERSVRIPGCPQNVATFAAHLRSQLGQREKAIRDLRELITYTDSAQERQKLVDKLAQLLEGDAAALAYELEVEKRRFEDAWKATRPEVPPTMYLLLGPPLAPAFRLDDLAVDRDLIGTEEPIEPLPPLGD